MINMFLTLVYDLLSILQIDLWHFPPLLHTDLTDQKFVVIDPVHKSHRVTSDREILILGYHF
jgi:hypothetical protein